MRKKLISSIMLVSILFSSTNIFGAAQRRTKGAAVGAGVGAIVGQVIGKNTKGTVIGAAVGSLAGLGWGAYRDKQEGEFNKRLGRNSQVRISRKGENLNLYLPSGLTFDTDKHAVRPSFYRPLNEIANVLIDYPETRIIVSGHTDSDGSEHYNLELSERRAQSIKNYLTRRGVRGSRISTVGYGEYEPIASNRTTSGKAQNRRVEIEILPYR
ncbi:MAG: OmpA family protein [Fusobacteriaceae bacterium]|nr:OmpA family protein [Fusobacteriaceae bacterium]